MASSSSAGGAACVPTTSPRCTRRPAGRSSPIRSRACGTSTGRSARPTRCSATSGFAEEHVPDVIVRIGRPAASKVLAQWMARIRRAGDPGGRSRCHRSRSQRHRRLHDRVPCSASSARGGDRRRPDSATSGWTSWLDADRRADEAIESMLDRPRAVHRAGCRPLRGRSPARRGRADGCVVDAGA